MNTTHRPSGESVIGATDVVVVGAGIIGLAHAVGAVRRGLTVTIVERDHRAVGASVRNFGHCCITAQHGELLEIAYESRELWIEQARDAGIWMQRSGALVVARSENELAVVEELALERGADQIALTTARQTGMMLGRDDPDTIVGGALLADDLRVDPRTTVTVIAEWLSRQPGVRFLWNTALRSVEPGIVRTSRGVIDAGHVFVCVGHDLDRVLPDVAHEHGILRCSLQMMLVDDPRQRSLSPAVLTGTSLLRYDAFVRTAAAAALAAEVMARAPELSAMGANVMFTQRPDGRVIVGDNHTYSNTVEPFLDEAVSTRLLQEAASVLGVDWLTVVERWQGVYASSRSQPFVVDRSVPQVTAVSVTSGIGMTISFGLAERVLASTDLPSRSRNRSAR